MQTTQPQTEWVQVLDNGLISIPKPMRDQMGIKVGDMTQATLIDNKIIIEPQEAVYTGRIFTIEEMKEWEKDDRLPPELLQEAKDLWPELQ